MKKEARKAILETYRDGYRRAQSRVQKSKILDDYCFISQYSRKHAIKILNGQITPLHKKKTGPRRKYSLELGYIIYSLWIDMGKPCSKRMKPAIALWLPFMKEVSKENQELLLSISPSTIDRLLKGFRKKRGISTTRASTFKNRIPIKLLDGHVKEPGHIEADTVAHCGTSLFGAFASTLTTTDLYSGWTENRAVWTRCSDRMVRAISSTMNSAPFEIKTWSTDNGTEFLNHEVVDHISKKDILVYRRRPYKKNDAAHVEQKNYTHVRQVFGYHRIEDRDLVVMMNEIYSAYWNPLQNLFMPMMKLKEKTRYGGRIIKRYDEPKTPYERLLNSGTLSKQEVKSLKGKMLGKNPFLLKKEFERRLKEFMIIVERRSMKFNEVA